MLNIGNIIFMPIHLFSGIQFGILSRWAAAGSKLSSTWPGRLTLYQIDVLSTVNESLDDAAISEICSTLPLLRQVMPLQKSVVAINKKLLESAKNQWSKELRVYKNEHKKLVGDVQDLLFRGPPHVVSPAR